MALKKMSLPVAPRGIEPGEQHLMELKLPPNVQEALRLADELSDIAMATEILEGRAGFITAMRHKASAYRKNRGLEV